MTEIRIAFDNDSQIVVGHPIPGSMALVLPEYLGGRVDMGGFEVSLALPGHGKHLLHALAFDRRGDLVW